MSEPPKMPPGRARPKPLHRRARLKIALAVSLALNLLVAGLVGGAVLGRGGPDEAPAIRALGLGPFAWCCRGRRATTCAAGSRRHAPAAPQPRGDRPRAC
jgi:hypothetical protein